jgi:hypothetical protein
VGLGANLVAMQRHAGDVVGGPSFGAAGNDDVTALWLDELDTARIGEALFGGIDDLHQCAVRARCR